VYETEKIMKHINRTDLDQGTLEPGYNITEVASTGKQPELHKNWKWNLKTPVTSSGIEPVLLDVITNCINGVYIIYEVNL
jgi:hypothetical protein